MIKKYMFSGLLCSVLLNTAVFANGPLDIDWKRVPLAIANILGGDVLYDSSDFSQGQFVFKKNKKNVEKNSVEYSPQSYDEVKTVNLTNRHLNAIPNQVDNCINLQNLVLANNELKDFPTALFSKLQDIDVSNNFIESVSQDDLERYPNLRYLNLSGNPLKSLELPTLPKLNWLTFSGDLLSSLPDFSQFNKSTLFILNMSVTPKMFHDLVANKQNPIWHRKPTVLLIASQNFGIKDIINLSKLNTQFGWAINLRTPSHRAGIDVSILNKQSVVSYRQGIKIDSNRAKIDLITDIPGNLPIIQASPTGTERLSALTLTYEYKGTHIYGYGEGTIVKEPEDLIRSRLVLLTQAKDPSQNKDYGFSNKRASYEQKRTYIAALTSTARDVINKDFAIKDVFAIFEDAKGACRTNNTYDVTQKRSILNHIDLSKQIFNNALAILNNGKVKWDDQRAIKYFDNLYDSDEDQKLAKVGFQEFVRATNNYLNANRIVYEEDKNFGSIN